MKGLPVRPTTDSELALGRHEARALFQLVEEVAQRAHAPEVDALVLDGSVDVALTRRGRTVDVTLGLPLLEALPSNEVRALLACELHGTSRRNVLARKRGSAATADRAAGENVGSVVVATALVRRELVRRVLDEDYWPAVLHGVQSSAHPHVKPFASLRLTLEAHLEAGALRSAASRLFAVESGSEPGSELAERLRALGVVPTDAVDAALLPVAAPAVELLGRDYARIVARLDAAWSERVDAWWEEAHREALNEALGQPSTPARVWTQANALARYREAHGRAPARR